MQAAIAYLQRREPNRYHRSTGPIVLWWHLTVYNDTRQPCWVVELNALDSSPHPLNSPPLPNFTSDFLLGYTTHLLAMSCMSHVTRTPLSRILFIGSEFLTYLFLINFRFNDKSTVHHKIHINIM
jgi:hypothetical protein